MMTREEVTKNFAQICQDIGQLQAQLINLEAKRDQLTKQLCLSDLAPDALALRDPLKKPRTLDRKAIPKTKQFVEELRRAEALRDRVTPDEVAKKFGITLNAAMLRLRAVSDREHIGTWVKNSDGNYLQFVPRIVKSAIKK
jgi:PAS domain-containing protein